MKIFLVSLLLITFSLIFSACSAAVHPSIETNERIPRSNSFDELSSRSITQMTVYSGKTKFFSTKRPYSKRPELTEYQRDLVLGPHPSALIDAEGTKKSQQLKQLKNQQLMPRRKQKRDDNDLCTGVCSIS